MENSNRNKILVRILIFMLIGDLIVAAAAVYFLSPEGSKILQNLRSIPPRTVITWIIGAAVLVIVLATPLALRKSGKCPDEFAEFANGVGLEPARKWGFEGNFGHVSLFGYGPYYEIPYKGIPLKYCRIVPEFFPRGGRLTIRHTRALTLGILCKYRLKHVFTEARLADEFKDIFATKLDSGEDDLRVWAVKKEEASALLRDERVAGAMKALQAELTKPAQNNPDYSSNSGFIINDKTLIVIFEEAAAISNSLVDSMYDLNSALADSAIAPGNPSPGLFDGLYKPVVVSLVVLTILAILAQITTSAFEFMGW